MTARRAPADHRKAGIDHRESQVKRFTFSPLEVAVMACLLEPDTDPESPEAKTAAQTVRAWLNTGKAIREGKPVKANRPYLFGIWSGLRWIVPGAEVADFLDRAKPAAALAEGSRLPARVQSLVLELAAAVSSEQVAS